MTISDDQLQLPRKKPRSLGVSLGYRAAHVGRRIVGGQRLLSFLLDGSRLFWQLGFELSGEIYDKEFHNQTKALDEEMLRRWIPENGSVIDIGCGSGRWCQVSAEYAAEVVGIDFEESEIGRARKESTRANVEYVLGDIRQYAQTRMFDLALLTHVIEHLDEPDKLLRDVRSIANKIIVEVPDFESDPLNWVRLRQGRQFYTDADHVREYTIDSLRRQVEEAGWRVIETRKNGGSVLVAAERQLT